MQFIFIVWEQYRKPRKEGRLENILSFCKTFLIVLLTKVIFNADSMTHAMNYYASMFHLSGNTWSDPYGMYYLLQYKSFFLAGIVFAFPVMKKLGELAEEKHVEAVWSTIQVLGICVLFAVDICYAVGGGYNPFIYFNF